MKSIHYTDARDKQARVLDDDVANGEPLIITQRSGKSVISVAAEPFEDMTKVESEDYYHWLFTEHGKTLHALKNR